MNRPSSDSSTTTVLVVSGGSFQGTAILEGLLRCGVRIVLADCYEEHVGRYLAHRSYVVPRVDQPEDFIDAIREICLRESVHVVIPSTDHELPLLASSRDALADEGIQVAVSSPGLLETVRNKRRLYEFLAQRGLSVLPPIDDLATSRVFPLIGKPLHGWGSRGLIIVHSSEELAAQGEFDQLQTHYVWQPYLDGADEFSADFAIDFHGRRSAVSVRQRIRTIGGFAVIARSTDEAAPVELAERVSAILTEEGGCGLFNVQLLRSGQRLVVSDVNPRIGTSAVFAYGEGLNLPHFLCQSRPEATARDTVGRRQSARPQTMVRQLQQTFFEDFELAPRAVVFDLDDTLLSQKEWIAARLAALHDAVASRLPDRQEFLARALAHVEEGRRSDLFDVLAADFSFDATFKAELIEAYRKIVPSSVPLFPDVLPVFGELRARGLKLAIVTDNPVRSQKQKLAATGSDQWCDAVVFSRDCGAEKPDTAAFVEAAARLGTPIDRLVMVGDNPYRDVRGALAAGYQHAFLIRRQGALLNPDVAVFSRLFPELRQFSVVEHLYDILRHLPHDVRRVGPDVAKPECDLIASAAADVRSSRP